MFEPSVYAGRRRALVAALAALSPAERGSSSGRVIFPGNRESPVNYADNAYRFRQDSSFLYFFGLAEPDLAASLDLASGRSTLYADELSIHDLVWTGPRPSADEYRQLCGADSVRPRAAFAADTASDMATFRFATERQRAAEAAARQWGELTVPWGTIVAASEA